MKIIKNNRIEYRNELDQLHREDGPTIISDQYNYQAYYQNGKLHRLDGPAYKEKNGYCEYWINNVQYSEENFKFLVFIMIISYESSNGI